MANSAVEGVGARGSRLLEREGIFLCGVVVADEAPGAIIGNGVCFDIDVEGGHADIAWILSVEHFDSQRVCDFRKDGVRFAVGGLRERLVEGGNQVLWV